MPQPIKEKQSLIEHLNRIIVTQSRLAEANFNVQDFLDLVVQQMQFLTQATGVVVELVDGDEMVYRAATGTVKPHIGLRLSRKNSISGLCVATREVLSCRDTEKDPRVNAAACRLVGARSLVVAPLFHKGEAIGVLKILSNRENAFNAVDVQTLQLMAGLIGSALMHQIFYETTNNLLLERTNTLIELERAQDKLKHMANYDFLTDLPNRIHFTQFLSEVIGNLASKKNLIAVMFLDIDHFKTINDTYGHGIGDKLLIAFSLRLKKNIRNTDMAARLGGDEFVILINQLDFESDAINIANKIISTMQQPFKFADKKFKISTSIGIAFSEDQTLSSEELLRRADEALYVAKNQGRNNYKVYGHAK